MSELKRKVERAKKAILEDIEEGILPEDVKSFEQLHDFVDANCYLSDNFKEEVNLEEMNAISEEVDKWIKGGRK